MAEKFLNTRIQLKYDTFENWEANKSKQLKQGEVAVVEVPSQVQINADGTKVQTAPTVLFKVGAFKEDGVTLKTFEELPWASALAADVHSWAKKPWNEFVADVQTAIDSGEAAYALKSDLDNLTTLVGKATDTADATTLVGQVKKAQADATKANEDLDEHVKAFETFKENNTQAIADAAAGVLGDAEDTATDNTVYGAHAAAAAAQKTADENAVAIATLNSDESKEGSVAKSIKDAKDELKGTTTDTKDSETIAGAKKYADAAIADFTKAYITPDDPDNNAIDKLQEIASWIADDEAGAAKIVADVDSLKTKVDNGELTDTTYTFADGTEGKFTVTPEGGTAITVDTGAKNYTDDAIATAIGEASSTDPEKAATGIHAVIEAGDKAIQSQVDGINTKIGRFGEATDTLVFNCGSATEVW